MRRFLYMTNKAKPLIVWAKKRPSAHNVPKSGTWVVNEFYKDEKRWGIPCFPEIVWESIKKMTYVGELK